MSLIFVLGFLSWLGFELFAGPRLKPVWAGQSPNPLGINLKGYAWADSIGWIKFGPYKSGNVSYGVSVDDAGNFLPDSWAWSDNVGWIAFAPIKVCANDTKIVCNVSADCGGASCDQIQPPSNACSGGVLACFDGASRKIKGWAYVVSMGSANGWLSLDGGADYGWRVRDESEGLNWGHLVGYAWGGETDTVRGQTEGLGWVSASTSTGRYYLNGRPSQITLRAVRNTEGANNTANTLYWDRGLVDVQKFKIYRIVRVCNGGPRNGQPCDGSDQCSCQLPCISGTCSTWPNNFIPDDSSNKVDTEENESALSYDDGYPSPPKTKLVPNVTYRYKVRACNVFACTESGSVDSKTSPFDDILDFKANPICKTDVANTAYVDLSWRKPYIHDSNPKVGLAKYELQYCILAAGQSLADCTGKWTDDYISCSTNANLDSDPFICRDQLTADRYKQRNQFWAYRVRAVGDDGDLHKSCEGGDKSGQSCVDNNSCHSDGVCSSGLCDASTSKFGQDCSANDDCDTDGRCEPHPSMSGWAYTRLFRVCLPAGNYEENRPK